MDGARCPTVPENEIHYDWECNPKWSVCPGGQYEKPEMLYDYLLPDYIAEVTTTTTTGMVTTTTTEEPTTATIPTTTTKRAKKHKHTQARFQTADGHKINKVREHRTDSRIQQKMDLDDIKTRYLFTDNFFTPTILNCFTEILFYTKVFAFLSQFFYSNVILHQRFCFFIPIFLHQKFCIFFARTILLFLHEFYFPR